MARISNIIITALNILTLILSIIAIGYSLWYMAHPGTSTICQKCIQKPLLFTGIGLAVLSLLGIIGSCKQVSCVLYLYSAVLFIMVVALIVSSVFVLIVTNKGVGKVVSDRGFKEYRLGDYSRWLQKYVADAKHWEEIKSCLADSRVCQGLGKDRKAEDFYKQNLTPLESGCCKPPTYCGHQFVNATYWIEPKTGFKVSDSDCKTWNNDQTQLCYNCKSCKAGVVANMKHLWRLFLIFNFCVLILVVTIYSISCCAIRNNKSRPPKHFP